MSKFIPNNKLQGKHKAFDQHLFEKYDIPARDAIKKVLGNFVIDNPDQYKQDLIICDETYKYKYIELQVCSNWIGETYPYDKVYVYERKGFYGEDTLFITLNKTLSKGYVFDCASFKNSKPRRFKKFSREFVYDIPWNKIMPITIKNLTIELLKLY